MTSPFRGSDSGLTPQRLRAKQFSRVSRDLYVLRDQALDLRTRTQAALLVFPDAVACQRTAALLQGLAVRDDGVIHLARGVAAPRSKRPGVRIHRATLDPDEILDLDGLRVTDGPRTYVDLAALLPLEALAAVGDVVLRRYGAERLRAAVDRRPRRRGLVLARAVLHLLDPGSFSPAETRARLRLHDAGFTALRHAVVVRDRAGGWLAEPDLADELAKVAVQHDGLVHLQGDPERRRKDLQRDELTRQADWQVVISTAIDDRRPHLLIAKVSDAYRRASLLLGAHVLPPHLRPFDQR